MKKWLVVWFLTCSGLCPAGEYCETLWTGLPRDEARMTESERRILDFEHGLLANELDLAQRARQFLNQAPRSAIEAIGAIFPVQMHFPLTPEDITELKNRFGPRYLDFLRRSNILDLSRLLLSDETWERVWLFYADQELCDFLAQALIRLKTGNAPHKKQYDEVGFERLRVFFLSRGPDLPKVADLLSGSSLMREGFVQTARLEKRGMDLTSAEGRRQAEKLVQQKRWGRVPDFMAEWFTRAFNIYSELVRPEFERANRHMHPEEFLSHTTRIWNDLDLFECSLRPFIFSAIMAVNTVNPRYSPKQVENAIRAEITDHLRLLSQLMEEGNLARSAASPAIHYRLRERRTLIAPEESTKHLDYYIHPEHIDQLRPDQDYVTRFRRDFGFRHPDHVIRFTRRAHKQLFQKRNVNRIAPWSWLAAIRAGPAPEKGVTGLKLLKTSPIPSMPHLDIEAKRPETGHRLLGHRDPLGRIVFEVLDDPHD